MMKRNPFNPVFTIFGANWILAALLAWAVPAQAQSEEGETDSVRELMNELLEPNARSIWNAISYVVNASGTEERIPDTEEDWQALRANAVALLGSVRLLQSPELRVRDSDEEEEQDLPDYQYRPGEIAALMRSERVQWLQYVDDMQYQVLQTMSAISRRDLERFSESSANINEACQGCHLSFMFRP